MSCPYTVQENIEWLIRLFDDIFDEYLYWWYWMIRIGFRPFSKIQFLDSGLHFYCWYPLKMIWSPKLRLGDDWKVLRYILNSEWSVVGRMWTWQDVWFQHDRARWPWLQVWWSWSSWSWTLETKPSPNNVSTTGTLEPGTLTTRPFILVTNGDCSA